jgi:hypothetical protein
MCYIVYSTSVVGMILIPGNLFHNKITASFFFFDVVHLVHHFSPFIRKESICSGRCIFPVSFPLCFMLLLFYSFIIHYFKIIKL